MKVHFGHLVSMLMLIPQRPNFNWWFENEFGTKLHWLDFWENKNSLQVLDWRSFLGIKTIHGLKCEFIHSFKNQFVIQLCVLGIKNQFVLQLFVDKQRWKTWHFAVQFALKTFPQNENWKITVTFMKNLRIQKLEFQLCATLVDDSFCLLLNWGSCINHTYIGCFRQTLAHTYTSFCTFHSREKSPKNLLEFRGAFSDQVK